MDPKLSVLPTKEELSSVMGQIGSDVPRYGVTEGERAAEEQMIRIAEQQRLAKIESMKNNTTLQQPRLVSEIKPEPVKKQPVPKQLNAPFDLIPLPSEGMLYPTRKPNIKIAYLNASDENILTSPHLLESGEFLDILLERKVLDEHIKPNDLHVGDRNAIMVWLRATAYGNMYPVQVINPANGELIETEIDLSELKIKKLGAIPDKKGCFDFTFPVSGKVCKFKLLSVGDMAEISEREEYELKTLNKLYADSFTFMMEKQIVELDGSTDPEYIRNELSVLRVGDSRALRKYINTIESGIDLNITIEVPGGEPFNTFLPVDTSFFWPKL